MKLAGYLLLKLSLAATAAGLQVDYVRDVRPILQEHCYECHGSRNQEAGLRLDIKSMAFKGGENFGASIVAGSAQDSPIIQFVSR